MTTEHKLVLKRIINATPEQVFDTFTKKEHLEKWYAPEGMTTEVRKLDVKEGGAFEIAMTSPDGNEYITAGVFHAIKPPTHISHTWQWIAPERGDESLITVDLKEVPDGTELTFTHEQFATEEEKDKHEKGWGSALPKLEKLFGSGVKE